MNIEIDNFGVIGKACVDIAPLNVFIGSNNSGKSFTARLIHCLDSSGMPDIDEELFGYLEDYLNDCDDKISRMIFDYLNTLPKMNSEALKIPSNDLKAMMSEVVLKCLGNLFESRIEDEFELSLDELINPAKNCFRLKIGGCELIKNHDGKLEFKTEPVPIMGKVSTSKIALEFDEESNLLINIESVLFNITELGDVKSLLLTVLTMIACSMLRDICIRNSYYLIAERSVLVADTKALTRRIQDKSYFSKNQIDILSILYGIDSASKSEFYDLGCDFDKQTSGYLVDVKYNGICNYISYTDADTGREVSSKALSTSIHETALLSIYLKYVVRKDDLLVIEEPEAHLHPRNQSILAKYLVRAVNNGLKVMLTTHSDYMIEQLNNFVRSAGIDAESLDELGYTPEDTLNHEDISIYTFKKDSEKLYITEKVEVNDTGFSEESLTPISEELYDECDRIIELM